MIAMTVQKVWCSGCKRMLKREAFNRNRSTRTGLQTYCRKCHNPMTYEKKKPVDPLLIVRRALYAYILSMEDGYLTPGRDQSGQPTFRIRDEIKRARNLLEELS